MTSQNIESTSESSEEVQATAPVVETSPVTAETATDMAALQSEYDIYKTTTNAAMAKLRVDIAGHENAINRLTTQNDELTKTSSEYESTKIQLTSVTAERDALTERLVEGAVSRLKGAGVDESKLANQSLSSLEAMLSAVEDVQKVTPTSEGLGLAGGRTATVAAPKTALEQAHAEMEILVSKRAKNGASNITQ